MHLIVTAETSEEIYTLEVSASMTLGDLRAYVEAESNVPVQNQILFYRANILAGDEQPLSAFNMEDYDMIMLRVQQPAAPPASMPTISDAAADAQTAIVNDFEKVRLQMLGDQALRDLVRQTYPDLVNAVNDPARFKELLTQIEESRLEAEEIKRRELKRLNDDPYNEESQRKILELIQQEAVMENLNNALEHNPESFGYVHMLYVPVEVNGHKIKAFVDSGAQRTIMSPSCAEACHVMFLLDRTFQGVARGVGTAKILGRIHSAPLKIGNAYLPCSFTVMEGKDVDLLLGLDMLKRHLATIDLKRNVLVLGDEEVPFLGEADLPIQARQSNLSEAEIAELTQRSEAEHQRELQQTQTQLEEQQRQQLGIQQAESSESQSSQPQQSGSEGSSGYVQPRSLPSGSQEEAVAPRSIPQQPILRPDQPLFPEYTSQAAKPSTTEISQEMTSTASPSTQAVFSETNIAQLESLGVSREEAISALRTANGNVEIAASLLFQ